MSWRSVTLMVVGVVLVCAGSLWVLQGSSVAGVVIVLGGLFAIAAGVANLRQSN